jgi:putative methionine-R-sulfoxide reductase with GAF domain
MPNGQGAQGSSSGVRDPADERERRVIELCERAVRRLAAALPDAEIGGLLRIGDSLRHVAHAGKLRLIYEIPREQGGVVWRAARAGEIQLVEDVRSDPDYLASDAHVRSEVAAPVTAAADVVLVLDVEFPDRVFEAAEVARIQDEAARLERELDLYPS